MTPCIPYSGRLNTDGYGYSGTVICGERLAHRIAYAEAMGPIPAGLTIDHLCRNRACINPGHLEAVTRTENTLRANAARGLMTHCRRGHEFTPDNIKVGSDGYRTCRTCYREKDRVSKARTRALAREFLALTAPRSPQAGLDPRARPAATSARPPGPGVPGG